MTFEEAKEEIKKGYITAGLELVDEHAHELFFNYRRDKFRVSPEDIEEYLQMANSRIEYMAAPSECAIISKNYREQIVSLLHPKANRMGPRFWNYHFGVVDGEGLYAEIGRCSDLFANYFRFQEAYLELCLEGPMRFRSRRDGGDFSDMKESIFRPLTIKIYNLTEPSIALALQKSNGIIENCIFTLSSLKENPIELLDEWPLRREKPGDPKNFEFGPQMGNSNLPLPQLKLNSTLVKLHQQATSSDIPSLKYLSFYQILEFHFLTVADENLYNSLARRINDLKFKPVPTQLDKLIQDVMNHKRDNDETEMLKSVIKKYVDEGDIIDFITQYEAFIGKKVYTAKRMIFGNDVAATALNSGHVIGNVAKTIKFIRNALVHSSDRYERNDRYVPYTKEATALLEMEMPLIKFLADKVVVAASS